ncbi:Gfo/Idh/MocA family protein [Geodermatophilus sp. SYSU D00698]
MDAVRIGVLGAARIVRMALLGPSRRVAGVEVVALAARDPARAAAYAERNGIPRVHPTYDDVLADPAVDAVYVPLPAALHGRWTLAAVAAGKHVLCEKPFTANAAQAEEVLEATSSSPCVVMEAYHSHYHPALERLVAILASGELGTIRTAAAAFAVPLPPGGNIRYDLTLGGGGLLDVGYYPVRVLRELFDSEPEVAWARATAPNGIDRRVDAGLLFDGGVRATVLSSLWSRRLIDSHLDVVGDAGRMRVISPYHPQLRVARIRVRGAAGVRIERPVRRSTYDYQLEAFRDAVRGDGSVPTDASAALAQMRVLDSIYRAAGLDPRSTPTAPV